MTTRPRHDRRELTTVRVEAPARLHLGMLDVAGGGTRRFGGLGVGVSHPTVVLEASPDEELSAEGPGAERALAFARRCHAALGLPGGARLRVLEAIPPHVGLGSGTKLALAVGRALAALAGATPDPRAIASAGGRGARSAVGLWTFALGGLVVEGGVSSGADRAGPLLARHPVPDAWRCVLVIPESEPGLSGVAEEEAFHRLRPTPTHAALVSHLVLTSLLPALVEGDVDEFGAALTRVQRLVGEGFQAVQGGPFHPRAGAVVDALLAFGAAGAGQSSWGPTAYGVVGSETQATQLAARVQGVVPGHARVEVVSFDNHGARLERTCASS